MHMEAKHEHGRDRPDDAGDRGCLDFRASLLCACITTHALRSAQSHPHTHRDHLACLRILKGLFVNCNHKEQSGSRRSVLSEPHSRGFLGVCSEHRDVASVCACASCVWHTLCEYPVTCACAHTSACVGGQGEQVWREEGSVAQGGMRAAPGGRSSQLLGFSQMLLKSKHLRLGISQKGKKEKKEKKTLELFCCSPGSTLSQPLHPEA